MVAGLVAGRARFGQRTRSLACSFGLLTAAAMGVHVSGGVTEAHFSFFVVVIVLTLYEDWTVFVLAVLYTLVHHGVLGTIDPGQVFGAHAGSPWGWAAIHAVFVAAAGAAGVVAWRLNEDVRHRMRRTEAELRDAAMTDSLTGLPNRRRLMRDLETAVGDGQARLALFDLDGFKGYNDTFGHLAGDALLTRLGHRLAEAVAGTGVAYRLGGDEFCVLARGATSTATIDAAVEALTEPGGGVRDRQLARHRGASTGTARSPRMPCGSPISACTSTRAAVAGRPVTRARTCSSAPCQSATPTSPRTAPTSPRCRARRAPARRAGDQLERDPPSPPSCTTSARSASPTRSLSKPGPLDADEWAFMRRHTIIGERIVAGAPALAQVGRLVRSSHEHFDGAGYPDALAGEQIPIGARIITVCDAYDAMITDRPYQAGRTPDSRRRRTPTLRRHPVRSRRRRRLLHGHRRPAHRRRPAGPTGPRLTRTQLDAATDHRLTRGRCVYLGAGIGVSDRCRAGSPPGRSRRRSPTPGPRRFPPTPPRRLRRERRDHPRAHAIQRREREGSAGSPASHENPDGCGRISAVARASSAPTDR